MGELTFSNHSINTSSEIRSPSNPSQLITRPDTVVILGTVDRSGDISCQQLSAIPMALRNPCRRVLGVKTNFFSFEDLVPGGHTVRL